MGRPKPAGIAIDAFFDNFTCAALFRRLRIPGSPGELVDPTPAPVYWANLGLEVIANARAALTEAQKIVLAGAVKAAFQERLRWKKAPASVAITNEPDLEAFLSEWSSCTKP